MLKTLDLSIDMDNLEAAASQAAIEQVAGILRSGGIVAFPTETVYGLGANALNPAAVARVFKAKRRPSWDPLIVHISDHAMLQQVAIDIPECAKRLMEAFWPGPLTLLVPVHPSVPGIVTGGRQRVGVRMPGHPVALELIRRTGLPIAAPSANTFGHTSPTSAAHVLEDLDGKVDAVLDGGETRHGLESTVLDACESPPIVYRPGVITRAQIAAVCGEARVFDDRHSARTGHEDSPESLPSPGMALRHYAPRARLLLIDGEGAAQRTAFLEAMTEAHRGKARVGLMLPDEFDRRSYDRLEVDRALVYRWGCWSNEGELAHRLFAGLRQLDRAGATIILCPLPAATGLGVAIRDRLQKAAR